MPIDNDILWCAYPELRFVNILKEGLIPNYCKEEYSNGSTTLVLGIPMISFCDIPLTRSQEFRNRYGKWAIAFKKEWAIQNGINPILYISNKSISTSLLYYNTAEMAAKENLEKRGMSKDGTSIPFGLSKSDLDAIKDFINYNNSVSANRMIFGFTKPYMIERESKPQVNYIENEWRYVVNENVKAGISWLHSIEEYDSWRGDKEQNKPVPSDALKSKRLIFSIDDITHILVNDDEEVVHIAAGIMGLEHICGTTLTEKDKTLLCSKIISFERIEKDF